MNAAPEEASDAEEPSYLGDLVAVERVGTVTEAQILASGLVASGIPATVADANLVQTDVLLTTAVGGVRVIVPASMVEFARDELAKLRSGVYELEGESALSAIPAPVATNLRLWSPDAAALWSLLLTPAFGCALHFLNGRALGNATLLRTASVGLVLGVLSSVGGMYVALVTEWGLTVVFRASLISSAYTAFWYLFAARPQSAFVLASFGRKYRHLPVGKAAASVVVGALAIGGLGEVL